jgi:hypothetical protein
MRRAEYAAAMMVAPTITTMSTSAATARVRVGASALSASTPAYAIQFVPPT